MPERLPALLAASTLALAGCGGSRDDPRAAFDALERALLEAETVRIRCSVTAEGAVSADLRGELVLAAGGRAYLHFEGTFAGAETLALMISDGDVLLRSNAADSTTEPAPAALREALVIGLTRMGILHNLAKLTSGAPPDRADGTVTSWVTVHDFGETPEAYGERRNLSFSLVVAGQPAGEATLVIDADGLPVERRQTVAFDEGEMRVVERYERVVLDGPVDADRFLLPEAVAGPRIEPADWPHAARAPAGSWPGTRLDRALSEWPPGLTPGPGASRRPACPASRPVS